MSGKPNISQAAQVFEALTALAKLREEIAEIHSAARQLPALEDRYAGQTKRVLNLLDEMDVASSDNGGWSVRVVEFLLMLREQAVRRDNKPPCYSDPA